MSKNKIFVKICLFLLIFMNAITYSVEYPIAFLNIGAGLGHNELATGLAIKGAFRYSFEAYIPGFQMELSYGTNLYQSLWDSTVQVKQDEKNIYQTKISDHQLGLSGLLQLKPFGKETVIFLGGGGNLNYIRCDSTWKEEYWDPEISDFQTLEHNAGNLLQKILPGYHYFGGIRYFFWDIGSIDIEVRKSFLNVGASDWEYGWAARKYGKKKWDNLSITVGLTINIF